MKISENGQKLIKNEEQLRLNAYRDQKGIPTIGWGHIRNVIRSQSSRLKNSLMMM